MSPKLPAVLLLAGALAVSVAPAARSGGAARGLHLYENHCTSCHESTVHIRDRRKARNLGEIESWVRRWSEFLALGWGAEEIGDVRTYLNDTYYGY